MIDTSIRNTMMFRLLFSTQDDHYNSELACDVLAAVNEIYDSEVVGVVLEIAAKVAQMEMEI
jgi:hypothetical protein